MEQSTYKTLLKSLVSNYRRTPISIKYIGTEYLDTKFNLAAIELESKKENFEIFRFLNILGIPPLC